MKAYFVSHKDNYGNQIARIFDEDFNRIDNKNVFCYSVIGKKIVGSIIDKKSIGSCRYDLIERFDFDDEVDADKFIASKFRDVPTEGN